MHKQHHRGPDPSDHELFAEARLPVLQRAAEEVVWLLGRGYPIEAAVRVVGDHHQLAARQRLALSRVCCSESARDARAMRVLTVDTLRGREVSIDGFNVVVTLETALGGGLVLAGRDGCYRDLAGLRGSYRMVDDTEHAIELLAATLETHGIARVEVLLESAVSNAGRLRGVMETILRARGLDTEVTLVRDADPLLAQRANVATADAAVLDQCTSWFNLARWIVERDVTGAWCVAM